MAKIGREPESFIPRGICETEWRRAGAWTAWYSALNFSNRYSFVYFCKVYFRKIEPLAVVPSHSRRRRIKGAYIHVMEYGRPQREEVAMCRVQDIHDSPTVASDELSSSKLRRGWVLLRRTVLLNEFMPRGCPPRDTIAVRIHIGRNKRIWEAQYRRRNRRSGRRRSV